MNENVFSTMIQKINVPPNFTRENINELGRKGPYIKYIKFPLEESYKISHPYFYGLKIIQGL